MPQAALQRRDRPRRAARETTAPIAIERPMLIETEKYKTCVAIRRLR
jgi:hypothetical protein